MEGEKNTKKGRYSVITISVKFLSRLISAHVEECSSKLHFYSICVRKKLPTILCGGVTRRNGKRAFFFDDFREEYILSSYAKCKLCEGRKRVKERKNYKAPILDRHRRP